MSNTSYTLTTKIHELLPQINQKYGLEIKVDSDFEFHSVERYDNLLELLLVHTKSQKIVDKIVVTEYETTSNCDFYTIPFLCSNQLRQILIGLREVLGENPEILIFQKQIEKVYKTHKEGLEIILNLTPKTQAEALCNRWLDGLTPLFDREPKKVLQELVEILEKLLEK